MALYESNIKVELREIILKNRPQELYNISPKGTVPVLQLNEHNIIDESLDIMLWALKKNNSKWIKNQFNYQMELIKFNDTTFKYFLDRYKYHDRYPEYSQKYYKEKCDLILNKYEVKLTYNNFIIGDSEQLVDIAIFPFIRQYAYVDSVSFEKKFPHLTNWFERLKSSDCFNSVMSKYSLWNKKTPLFINFKKTND